MKRFFLAICLLLSATIGFSQASLSVAQSPLPGLPDTAIMNQNVTYLVSTTNVGSIPFSGTYSINVGVDTNGVFVGLVYSGVVAPTGSNIQPTDTDTAMITHSIDSTKFREGGNTIVIWPSSGSAETYDTLYRDIYVITFNTIPEADKENYFTIYPNPATEWVMIRSKTNIEQVRVFTIDGQLIDTISNSRQIQIDHLTPGIYLVEILDEKGTRKHIRIIKS